MAYTYSVNQTPLTGSIAMYQLISALLTAGWSQKGSGDGSTYVNGGGSGPVANGNTGATGLGNTTAWVRLTAPSLTLGSSTTLREILIQRAGSDTSWWIRYSWGATFTGGSPSATVAPTATDQVNIIGTGSGAGGTMFGTNNTYRCNVMAGDSTLNYGFYLVTFATGGGATCGAFVMDPIQNPSPQDKDPYIFYCHGSATAVLAGAGGDFGSDTSFVQAFMSTTISAATWQTLMSSTYYNPAGAGNLAPAGMGVDPFNSSDHIWPIFYGRRNTLTAPNGTKGFGTIIKFTGVARSTGDTLSVSGAGAKDYLVVNGGVVPWNGSTPTV